MFPLSPLLLLALTTPLLKNLTTTYIHAQTSGTPSLLPLTPTTLYTENTLPLPLTSTLLTTPLRIDAHRSLHDPVLCGSFTELIVATSAHQYVIGTRMLLATNGTVESVESIVTEKGDWAFDAGGYLYWSSFEDWDPIPIPQRDSRAVIKAAGDAYFNRFSNPNITIPFSSLCARLEGGLYTSRSPNLTANTCSLGLPSNTRVSDRRYVVDEEVGAVDIYLGFMGLDRSHVLEAVPDSHLFRVERGGIRYIHTLSRCLERGCGMNGTGMPLFERGGDGRGVNGTAVFDRDAGGVSGNGTSVTRARGVRRTLRERRIMPFPRF
ncbi:hypothetical protein HYFRA_00011156 [Hymenoscyphus fraxineus]|uniref:DUF8021 domain-containing protein n=1 Tax=Hymenoscyphus fraxineus TaxID=746836 RepID=A0A9N9PWM7_9HELO|nr:hypothetical protein HYFRA_00011156 [Hymenoscyphus fraxineus]